MRSFARMSAVVAVVVLLVPPPADAEESALPEIDGQQAAAVVNGEPITMDEFLQQLGRIHGSVDEPESPIARQSPSALLERLINVKLILQEAEAIGLDQLPEVTVPLESFERDTLKQMLFAVHVRGLPEPDPEEVERLYRIAVKEVQVASVLIESEEDARELESRLEAGEDFDALAVELSAAGKATGYGEPRYMKIHKLLPWVRTVIADMDVGEVSPLIELEKGYSFVKLYDIRIPEDPEARKLAAGDARKQAAMDSLGAYTEKLREQHVTVNEELFNSLDFEAEEPGFEELLADERVLAELDGEEPITVGALTEKLKGLYFHGVDRAIEKGRVNKKSIEIFDRLLLERAVLKEARRLELDRTEEYRARVAAHREGMVFGTFVKKIVEPDIKLSETMITAYFDEHVGDYTYPEMIGLESLAFVERADAEKALDKLRRGADYKWTRENAGGQVEASEDANDAPVFDGRLILADALPEEIRKTVVGAETGEFRFHAEPGGPFMVLFVREIVPSRPMAYDRVKEEIAGKVYRKRRKEVIDDWTAKLREASEIEIFATDEKLYRVLLGDAPGDS